MTKDQSELEIAAATPQTMPAVNEAWPPPSSTIDLDGFKKLLKDSAYQPGPASIAWRVNGEIVLALGWGRAILMQVAHPLVAQGVADHSHFASSTLAKMQRFKRTLDRMLFMTFGSPEEAWSAGQYIDNIHARINRPAGEDGQRGYSARDPELLKWVHVTFVDSMLKTYELFVAPLTIQEKNDYVRQASLAGPLVGAPVGYFPADLAELEQYLKIMLEGDSLLVTSDSRRLAAYVLAGLPLPVLGLPLNWYSRLVVAGTLPARLVSAYGLKFNRLDAVLLRGTAWLNRRVRKLLPRPFKRWRLALKAEAAAGKFKKVGQL